MQSDYVLRFVFLPIHNILRIKQSSFFWNVFRMVKLLGRLSIVSTEGFQLPPYEREELLIDTLIKMSSTL